MGEFKLIREILSRSVADNWDNAKLEWRLTNIEDSEEPETCLCGHFPIVELCELTNKINGSSVIVGNCCVTKFLGINSNKLFAALKKVKSDITISFNAETIELAYERGYITSWERNFYIDIWRKRNLSTKQLETKTRINLKVLSRLRRSGM